MAASPANWHSLLVAERILTEDADDPILEILRREADNLNWRPLIDVLRGSTLDGFNEACQTLYWEWMDKVEWRSSLLILDEAHHAKNDGTRLAGLFRSEGLRAALEGKRPANRVPSFLA